MNVHDVARKVAQIEDGWNASYDDEVAHADQDALYEEVLAAIAAGAEDPAALAAEVLKARGVPFSRWYA